MDTPPLHQSSNSSSTHIKPSFSPGPLPKISSLEFSGTNASNPLGNSQYEEEISNRMVPVLISLNKKQDELLKKILKIKFKKTSPVRDQELQQLDALQKEWDEISKEKFLIADQMYILDRRDLARVNHHNATVKRQEEER
ncbi:hypothetical protein HDU76_006633, partial [Blyttiomyces sp. JEL0837]